jgi:hypothetical protein
MRRRPKFNRHRFELRARGLISTLADQCFSQANLEQSHTLWRQIRSSIKNGAKANFRHPWQAGSQSPLSTVNTPIQLNPIP